MTMENKKRNNGWILCSNQLPAVIGEYNVLIKDFVQPTTLYYYNGIWHDDNNNLYEVLAWQPLPDILTEFISNLIKDAVRAERERIVRELDNIKFEFIKVDGSTFNKAFIEKGEVLNIIDDLPFY